MFVFARPTAKLFTNWSDTTPTHIAGAPGCYDRDDVSRVVAARREQQRRPNLRRQREGRRRRRSSRQQAAQAMRRNVAIGRAMKGADRGQGLLGRLRGAGWVKVAPTPFLRSHDRCVSTHPFKSSIVERNVLKIGDVFALVISDDQTDGRRLPFKGRLTTVKKFSAEAGNRAIPRVDATRDSLAPLCA
jgi:hypothetical protein